jgi:pyruvate formate lyase activating enzyme
MSREEPDTLRTLLGQHAAEAELYRPMDNGKVECTACGHRCTVLPGREGICKVRFNRGGTLFAPRGYVAGLAVDPIEKKPFYHAFPGRSALSFGMLGCDYHCSYCQNWITSQALRDPAAGTPPTPIAPEKIVGLALEHHTPVITSTYNEPLITSEWAVEIFRLARKYGIACSYVSNGNGTPEVIDYLRPHVRLFKVDLKSFRQKNYQQLGGTLAAVTDSIRRLVEAGIWVEVVTLVVPGFNDSDEELRDIANYLASVSPDIPWHLTAFHQDYRMTDPPATSAVTLMRAADLGRSAGLRFVYAGNLPGQTGRFENTYCPSCQTLLVERRGFHVTANRLEKGRCPTCTAPIPGVWE